MGIKASSSGDSIDIVITGQVRGVSEIEEIKSAINDQGNASSIKMTLEDAFVVPSAFIGYLLKLSQVEGKDITIVAKHRDLVELFDTLNINSVIKVVKG